MLAFFTWETVHSSVMHQYSRDFKGHLLALFRPDVADQGKQYVFDVQRTWREAYDRARRILHKQNLRQTVPTEQTSLPPGSPLTDDSASRADQLKILQERLSVIQDALTCRICMDREINSVFWPCGHQMCCHECASLCQNCPICRHVVDKVQIVFPAISRDFVATGNDDQTVDEPSCSPLSTAPHSPIQMPRSRSPSRPCPGVEIVTAN